MVRNTSAPLPLPRRHLGRVLLTLGCLAGSATRADVVVYSNLATFTGQTVQSPLPVWDDIQIDGGGQVSAVSFRAFNTSGTARPLAGLIELREFNLSLDSPVGNLLAQVPFDFPTQFADGLTDRLVVDFSAEQIDLPTDARLGLGIVFDDLAAWATPMFDPPAVGLSDNRYWLGFNPTPIVGDGYNANFAWELSVVPEPASLAGLLAGLALGATRRPGSARRLAAASSRPAAEGGLDERGKTVADESTKPLDIKITGT